ncbi:hypothetical protein AP20H10_06870 [Apilactobacillus apinorum]|uniref:Uncharacterized protein n=1 Tax=Apilactobacillus apinorum TaxID=1218495 RepID=A0ABP9ZHP0_9LACO
MIDLLIRLLVVGSVWIESNFSKNAINDISKDLINLYNNCTESELLSLLYTFDKGLDSLMFREEMLSELEYPNI